MLLVMRIKLCMAGAGWWDLAQERVSFLPCASPHLLLGKVSNTWMTAKAWFRGGKVKWGSKVLNLAYKTQLFVEEEGHMYICDNSVLCVLHAQKWEEL
jgi:hypothetical protein